ncbi:DNA helicase/exodeoxyribonuclease V, alpha subunit [Modicisalibacter ilicicola DSM 19980]|uniref:RecBCD enzyme subunit RecD n=1 Tax=Modicisalibacter ilicicola DSM 19980 TaxID=1121942 RepID=A0A1M4TM36_9GAMM|nr:exodeoxyribonuclease V subunit alpha [Halomonas ilicicola]SHE45552.1 DNA helicase/exodeoxyribonuclease V, alpha subunit [Halomonas ilicicola DSM 19980]
MKDLFEGLEDDAFEATSDNALGAFGDALDTAGMLLDLLDRWVERGWLRALDRALAMFLHREVPEAPPLLLLAAALASHQLGRGHVCLDLGMTLQAPDLALSLPPEGDDLSDPPPLPGQVLANVTLTDWRAALDQPALVGRGSGSTPLVTSEIADSTRLYLRRYWQYEQDIRQALAARIDDTHEGANADTPAAESLRRALEALFGTPDDQPEHLDWQKLACALAARSRFAVITGGPGTGKTTTVVKLLALLQALQLGHSDGRALRIRLAAPTGKAAARLNESIAGQVETLPLAALVEQCDLAQRVASDGEARRSQTKTRSLQAVNEQLDEGFNTASSSAVALLIKETIPTEVTTLHRLLGSRPDTRRFRHHADNPLALDVLVVDEASMVDIEMMASLLAALPPRARLILLGDKDQLASVEAGAVLGDLCQRADGGHYRPETAVWLQAATGDTLPERYIDTHGQPLDQAIAMLRVSHRFDAASGIGQLAQAVNAPLGDNLLPKDKRRAIQRIFDQGYADISRLRLKDSDDTALDRLVIDGNPEGFLDEGRGRRSRDGVLPPPTGYRHYLGVMKEQRPPPDADLEHDRQAFDDWARAVLEAHGRFQVLCALRKGPWGVEGLNRQIAGALKRQGLIDAEHGWYPGRPVLVTRNDYGLGLMNGDIGITLAQPHPEHGWLLRVAFPSNDGSGRIKWVLPSRLQAVETVFAMTVHKSQGSEFTHTALVLPDAPNPILTRELIYTGITRAKDWFTLVESGRGVLDEAVLREVTRVSGLGVLGDS